MIKQLFLLTTSLLFAGLLSSQSLNRAFPSKEFYVNQSKIQPTIDGGWLLLESVGEWMDLNFSKLWLTRLNAAGETISTSELVISSDGCYLSAFKALSDGRFLAAWSDFNCGSISNSVSIALLDKAGQQIWQRSYNGIALGMSNDELLGIIYDLAALPERNLLYIVLQTRSDAPRIKLELSTGNVLGNIKTSSGNSDSYLRVVNHPVEPNQLIWLSRNNMEFYRSDTLDHLLPLPYVGSGPLPELIAYPGNPNMLLVFQDESAYRLNSAEEFEQLVVFSAKSGAVSLNEMAVYSRQYFKAGEVEVYENTTSTPYATYQIPEDKHYNSPKQHFLLKDGIPYFLILEEHGGFDNTFDYVNDDDTYFSDYNSNRHSALVRVEENGLSTENTHDVGLLKVDFKKRPLATLRDTFGTLNLIKGNMSVTIGNYGLTPLESVQINFFGGANERICVPVFTYFKRINGLNVPVGETTVIELEEAFPESILTYTDFCVWTSLPNDKSDRNINNDTYCLDSTFYRLLPTPDQFRVFPNPAQDQLLVSFEIGNLYGAAFSIWSPTGQVLLDGVVRSESDYYVFDIGTLPKGMYFMKAGDRIVKFVKM